MSDDCFYDYANKCDCSEDDKCGCTFPNNMPHDFSCNTPTPEPIVPTPKTTHSVLMSSPAPDFTASAVMPDDTITTSFNLYQYLDNVYGFLIFYPADFTYVCPSELVFYNKMLPEFERRKVRLLGISTDSAHAHLAWKKMSFQEGGIGKINFPLVSDIHGQIAASYGVLNADGTAMRASFLLDLSKIVRYLTINDERIGRDPAESLRITDALQFTETNGNVCPAGWHQGDAGIERTMEDVARVLQNI